VTTIRLVGAHGGGESVKEIALTSVRLVANGHAGREDIKEQALSTVRLAHCGPPDALVDGLGPNDDGGDRPALLVSYFYLDAFLKAKARYDFRDWVMDSGAFSAHNSGAAIDLDAYIAKCQELKAGDPQLSEVFSLDVIGDWRASLKNTEAMWKAGVRAIPCFHVGEPEDVLVSLARDYPKIALGGAVGFRGKREWARQCLARVWPKRVHGFGFGSEGDILAVPFHSVDATNWELGPCRFGQWKAYGGNKVSVRGSKQNLRVEVEWYLALERRAQKRWAKQMKELEALPPT
jgi:hypothetical protein